MIQQINFYKLKGPRFGVVNYLGLVALFVNLVVAFLLKGIERIGPKKGAMIGGWVGAFVNVIIFSTLGVPIIAPYCFTLLSAVGILGFISILIILYQTSNPEINFQKNIVTAILASAYRSLKWMGLGLNLLLSIIILFFA